MTALTPIASFCQLRAVNVAPGGGSANIVASDTALVAYDLPVEVDAVSSAFIEVASNSPLAAALAAAAGGYVPSTSTQKLIAEISFSGTSAGPFDYYFIVEQVERGLTVIARGRCLYGAYADNAVARLTLNRATLADALNGVAGTIAQNSDPMDTGITYAFQSLTLFFQKGLFQTEPNPPDGVNDLSGHSYFRMPVSVSDKIATLLVDADSKDDFIDSTAHTFIALTMGLPLDGTPLGSYSHIVADTSDASLNLTGTTKGIGVGFLGTEISGGGPDYSTQTDHLTFARNPSPVDTTKALIIEPAEGLKLVSDLAACVTKIKPSGGYSNHGLPVGFTIADGLCLPNNSTDSSTTHWYDALFLFVGHDASGLGGLYYWPHNGLAYRIGQALDFAACLAYDPLTNKIYVGCRGGVYSILATPSTGFPAQLTREGSLNLTGSTPGAGGVIAVRVGASSTITAQVQGSGPADGIYYRNAGAPTGWDAFDTAGPLIGYHYDAAGDTLYVAYTDNATQVMLTNNARTTTPTNTIIPITGGAHITGLDDLGGLGPGVRTELGALGLYIITAGALVNLDPSATMLDRYGASPRVNRIQFAAAGLYIGVIVGGIPTEPAVLVASTDAGPYVNAASDGTGTWLAMPTQSGIGAESIQGAVVAYPQTLGGDSVIAGRLTTRMYCWTSSSLWISHSAGIWFDDELQEKTNLGPFLTALYPWSSGGAGQPFLDNSVSVIGIGATTGMPDAPAAAGTSGKAVYVPAALIAAKGLQNMASTALWLRPLDERNRFTYLFINTAGASPTGRIVNADFPSIQSDNATPAATASGKLAQATIRKYHDAAIIPHDVQFDSVLAFQEMKLRTLRPSHRVATDYTTRPQYTVDLSTTKFYVRKVRFYKGRGDNQVQVQVDASTVFRSAVPSDQAIGDALGVTVSKMIRQGHQ